MAKTVPLGDFGFRTMRRAADAVATVVFVLGGETSMAADLLVVPRTVTGRACGASTIFGLAWLFPLAGGDKGFGHGAILVSLFAQ